MAFRPLIPSEPALMDPRIFADGPMNLRPDLLEMPMDARLAYDPAGKLFFVNFEGLTIRSAADIERIRAAVEARVAPIGHKVSAVVNYDRFNIDPELIDAYAAMVKKLVAAHYTSVTRYTSSTFLRLQLGAAFTRSEQPPRMYGSVGEAQAGLAAGPAG
jgi:propionate CoA-transferase